MISWHIETIKIKELKEHPKNPRQINKDQFTHLTNLIAKFGLIDKPIVNKDLTIIGGHQRVKVLKKLKKKEVECWVPEQQLTEEQIEHLMVGLNKNQGQWDWDILANEFEPLDLLSWGFSEEELVGEIKSVEDEEKPKGKKKAKMCPSCGHEF